MRVRQNQAGTGRSRVRFAIAETGRARLAWHLGRRIAGSQTGSGTCHDQNSSGLRGGRLAKGKTALASTGPAVSQPTAQPRTRPAVSQPTAQPRTKL